AAHPEDAGRTVKDFRWVVHEIVLEPQEPIEDELTAKEAEVEKIEDDIVVPADASDKDAAVSETPPALNVSFDCSARSTPSRPVHQRPARDQRRPTWKKWER